MNTAHDLIADSLAAIGAVDPLEALSADEAAHGLRLLNELLESWSTESLLVYQILQENFATLGGVGSYAIGPGALWDAARPLKIESAFIREADADTGLTVLDREEYDAISNKTTRGRPDSLFYDPALPQGIVSLFSVPDAVYSVVLNSYKQLQRFAALVSEVVLPPGYLRAIKHNLALELAPGYNKPPSAVLVAAAREAKAVIKRLNSRTPKLAAFQGFGGFNITIGA